MLANCLKMWYPPYGICNVVMLAMLAMFLTIPTLVFGTFPYICKNPITLRHYKNPLILNDFPPCGNVGEFCGNVGELTFHVVSSIENRHKCFLW
jgi:hypothetical protein